MKTRRPPGRPPASSPKAEHLHIRAGEEQLSRWRAAAERDGRTLSNWVARILDAGAVRR